MVPRFVWLYTFIVSDKEGPAINYATASVTIIVITSYKHTRKPVTTEGDTVEWEIKRL